MKQLVSMKIGVAAIILALAAEVVVGRALSERSEAPMAALATTDPPIVRYKIPVSMAQPRLGPSDALVTIVQWCDLPDPACAALEPTLQSLLARHPDAVSLVFRHYPRLPLDKTMPAHVLARAAHAQAGKFWQARAVLLDQTTPCDEPQLRSIAQTLGLDGSSERAQTNMQTYGAEIGADRMFADMFDVHDSPALFVNGRPLGDRPRPEAIEQLVEQELSSANALVAGGLPKSDVYAALIKNGRWNKPSRTPN